jgi:hypothetical protein
MRVSPGVLFLMPKLAGYNQPLLIPASLVLPAHRKVIFEGFLPRALTSGGRAGVHIARPATTHTSDGCRDDALSPRCKRSNSISRFFYSTNPCRTA